MDIFIQSIETDAAEFATGENQPYTTSICAYLLHVDFERIHDSLLKHFHKNAEIRTGGDQLMTLSEDSNILETEMWWLLGMEETALDATYALYDTESNTIVHRKMERGPVGYILFCWKSHATNTGCEIYFIPDDSIGNKFVAVTNTRTWDATNKMVIADEKYNLFGQWRCVSGMMCRLDYGDAVTTNVFDSRVVTILMTEQYVKDDVARDGELALFAVRKLEDKEYFLHAARSWTTEVATHIFRKWYRYNNSEAYMFKNEGKQWSMFLHVKDVGAKEMEVKFLSLGERSAAMIDAEFPPGGWKQMSPLEMQKMRDSLVTLQNNRKTARIMELILNKRAQKQPDEVREEGKNPASPTKSFNAVGVDSSSHRTTKGDESNAMNITDLPHDLLGKIVGHVGHTDANAAVCARCSRLLLTS